MLILAAAGLVKAHFYNMWVQSKILRDKDLDVFHQLMAAVRLNSFTCRLQPLTDLQCTVPDHLGRLPVKIGKPAGGSLTADQWIILGTVMGPLIVCTLAFIDGLPD